MAVEINGMFVNNQKNGFGTVSVDGQVVYEGGFRNDVIYGRGRAYFLKKGNLCDTNGIMSIGEHRMDKRYSYFFVDERKFNSGCKIGRVYGRNGKLQQDGFLDDDFYYTKNESLPDGFAVYYHPNGQIMSIGGKVFRPSGVEIQETED
jgi:hypothetical protein